MRIGELQKSDTSSSFPFRKLAGWLSLAGSIPMMIWVGLAGVIAVPYPSYLSLYGGPAIACFLVGLGLLNNSGRLIAVALVVLLLGILGWFVLP